MSGHLKSAAGAARVRASAVAEIARLETEIRRYRQVVDFIDGELVLLDVQRLAVGS